MDEARWLDAREERAWRGLMAMEDALTEFLERRLRTHSGLSQADYQVLAHLSEAGGRGRGCSSSAPWCAGRRVGSRSIWDGWRSAAWSPARRCATDQRGCVAVITPEGTDRITAAAPQHVGDVRAALVDHLTADELEKCSPGSAKGSPSGWAHPRASPSTRRSRCPRRLPCSVTRRSNFAGPQIVSMRTGSSSSTQSECSTSRGRKMNAPVSAVNSSSPHRPRPGRRARGTSRPRPRGCAGRRRGPRAPPAPSPRRDPRCRRPTP